MLGSSDLSLDVAAEGFLNLSQGSSFMPLKSTPIKQNSDISEVTEDEGELNCELKINKSDLNVIKEVQLIDEKENKVVKSENNSRRRSISDLVERYKKVLELSNYATVKIKNQYMEHDIE